MTRSRNTNSRKPQQSVHGAHNTFRRTTTGPPHRGQARKAIQTQDQTIKEGHDRRGRSDNWSMSPQRGDAQGDQHTHHRHNERSRTPLTAHTTQGDLNTSQKVGGVRGIAIQDGVDQVPAKRKREADDDNKLHVYKKAHTEAEEMQPAAVVEPSRDRGTSAVDTDQDGYKRIADLATIQKMSEEEKRKFRGTRFRSTHVDPSKAAISNAASEKSRHAKLAHSEKDDHKTVRIPPTKPSAKLSTPHVTGQKSEASSVRHSSSNNEVVVLELRDEAGIQTTVVNPQIRHQSTAKIASEIQAAGAERSGEAMAAANLSTVSSKADVLPTKHNKRKQNELEDIDTIPTKSSKKSETANVNHAAIKRRNEKIKRSLNDQHLHADQNRLPGEDLTFVAYDAYSIPLLCSRSIEHGYPFEIVNKPSDKLKRSFENESEAEVFSRKMLVLRQEALRLSAKRFWTSEDLGRKKTSKNEPARVVDDCDLYLYNGKTHVATEQGLLPVTVYLKLIGVPDTQSVRFNGHKPTWMSLITTRTEHRRVLTTWEPTPVLREGGCISIMSGSIVVVYEHGIFDIDTRTGEESQMAYGARTDDGATGWFMYANTCRMDWLEDPEELPQATPDPNMIDWAKFDFGPLAARAAAHQAALSAPTAVAQEPLTNNEHGASNLPVSRASMFVTPDKLDVASPAEVAIPAASEPGSESDAESTHSSLLRERRGTSLLSVAPESVSRHNSPNCRSDESASDEDNDMTGKTHDFQDSTAVTPPQQATNNGPANAQDTPTCAFSEHHQILTGLEGLRRCQEVPREPEVLGTPAVRPDEPQPTSFRREEDVLDWDDFDL